MKWLLRSLESIDLECHRFENESVNKKGSVPFFYSEKRKKDLARIILPAPNIITAILLD